MDGIDDRLTPKSIYKKGNQGRDIIFLAYGLELLPRKRFRNLIAGLGNAYRNPGAGKGCTCDDFF